MPDLNSTSANTPNPFDLASLRFDQSYADTVSVKKLLTTVPVRKRHRQEFVRVRRRLLPLSRPRKTAKSHVTPNMARENRSATAAGHKGESHD
jgi:hypothetical protein